MSSEKKIGTVSVVKFRLSIFVLIRWKIIMKCSPNTYVSTFLDPVLVFKMFWRFSVFYVQLLFENCFVFIRFYANTIFASPVKTHNAVWAIRPVVYRKKLYRIEKRNCLLSVSSTNLLAVFPGGRRGWKSFKKGRRHRHNRLGTTGPRVHTRNRLFLFDMITALSRRCIRFKIIPYSNKFEFCHVSRVHSNV